MIDDPELLRRYVQEKSDAAFAELVQRHVDLVFSAALPRVGRNSQLAEDVTQRVFSDLARKAGTLTALPTLAGWLYTSTRFAASDVVRHERRLRARERVAHEMNTLAMTDANVDWEQLRPVLEDAIDQLEPANRDAVALRFFGRKSFGDIAATLRLSEDAAQKRVDRSLDKLRTLLAQRGITSPTAALATVLAANVGTAAPAGLAAQVTTAALASLAATSGATAAGFLQLVGASKITSSVATTLALLVIGYGVYEYQAANAAGTALAGISMQETALHSKLADVARLQREANEASQLLAAQLEQARQAAAARPAAAAPSPAQQIDLKAIARQNLDLATAMARASTRLRWGPFYRAHNLTESQIEAMERLQMEADTINGFAKNGTSSDPTENALRDQARTRLAEIQDALGALIGDAAEKDFGDYQWTADLRNIASAVALATYFTDTPLGADQGERLAQLLIASSSWAERHGRVDPASIKWDVVMPQAKEFLSSTQVAALEAAQMKAAFDEQYRKLTGSPVAPARLPGL
jgi:RNA polymerase sigma factor (sigma-70 family)